MKYIKVCVVILSILLFLTIFPAQSQNDEASIPPFWTFFPETLYCSEIPEGIGPRWRDQITIGQTTVEELEALYGLSEPRDRMYMTSEKLEATYGTVEPRDKMHIISGEYWAIRFCTNDDNVITALMVGSDLAYFQDYVAIYGIPDVTTFGTSPTNRIMLGVTQLILRSRAAEQDRHESHCE